MTALSDRILERVSEIMGLPAGDAAGDLNSAAIIREANRVFQFEIPNRVGGWAQQGVADVTVGDGDELLDSTFTNLADPGGLAMRFKTVTVPLLIDSDPIYFTTYPSRFWSRYRKNDTAKSRPWGALYYGGSLRLRPIPDQDYTLTIHGIEYRQDSVGDIEALPDPIEEDWIVWGAAMRLALVDGRIDVVELAKAALPYAIDEVSARNLSTAGKRRARRTF
jgi:hypothetical protein